MAIQTAFEAFEKNTPAQARKLAKRYDLAIPVGHDGAEGAPSRTGFDYRATGTPWIVIIDAQGIVRANDYRLTPEQSTEWIEKLRAEARIAAKIPEKAGPPPGPGEIRETILRLGDPDFGERERAFERLLDWGRADPERVLAELPERHDDAAIDALCGTLRECIASDRELLASLAAASGSPELARSLVSFFARPSVETVEKLERFAADAESRKAVRTAILPGLDALSRSPDRRLRARTTRLIVFLEPEDYVPYLARAVWDTDRQTRDLALKAAVERIAAVESLRESPDPAMREAAKSVLGQIEATRKRRQDLSDRKKQLDGERNGSR